MEITLNGEKKRIESEVTLDLFSLPRQRVAIERNGEVVSRAAWPDTIVSEGDKIEIVHFVGGG